MPKWTDYTIKTEPADKDELMILDTAGKANKRLGLSALSDWIIGKIASKVFENLQTQNKTILGAINELNSKAGTVYCKGIRNFEQKYETIMIRAKPINEACFFTMLAGALTKQYSAIIYGVTKNNQVMVKEIMNNGNVSVIGNLTDNSITIDIGNWGRGLILSYIPFEIEIK